MSKQIVRFWKVRRIALVLFALLLAGCGSQPSVGELRNESQSVELGSDKSAKVNNLNL